MKERCLSVRLSPFTNCRSRGIEEVCGIVERQESLGKLFRMQESVSEQ
jgi:hypothetical protein